jgi:serine/threonine protein kinase
MNATVFINALKEQQLVDPQIITALSTSSNFKGEVANLIKTGVLTKYQVNMLLQGKSVIIGNYIILDAIGEGGMGQVFKVRNKTLNTFAALKVIHQNRLQKSQTAAKRFKREIQITSKLNHLNVVRAYDANEINGSLILVMEYVEGTDLSKLVKQNGPLPIDKACNYISQVAAGLQHAHELGMVHRDIKPQNLLLNKMGEVKILDMGLARSLESSDETTLTQEGSVVGTPDYLAPEQAVSAHNVDIRADIYSLGVTFYYLLTGKVPFTGGSLTEKLLKHQTEDPTPVEKLRPEVPANVAAVIRKMMAKKPANRYQVPQEVVDKLSELNNSKAIQNTSRFPHRIKLMAGGIIMLLFITLLMFGGDKDSPRPSFNTIPASEQITYLSDLQEEAVHALANRLPDLAEVT